MANEIDLSLLTTDDYQDYWNQFLRFYADESGKNFSKKLPISYLDKVLRNEIIKEVGSSETALLNIRDEMLSLVSRTKYLLAQTK